MSDLTQNPPEISRFRGWRAWRREHGGERFPTDTSIEWFMRRNRRRLVQSGQLILKRGKGGSLVGPRFGEVVIEIERERSTQLAAESRDRFAAA